LPQDLQDVAAELRLFIQEEHAVVRQRHLARQRHVAAADQPGIAYGMIGVGKGRAVTNTARSPASPATRWMRVVSRASARIIGGRMVGQCHPSEKWLPVIY
jgi:hypothetical protein